MAVKEIFEAVLALNEKRVVELTNAEIKAGMSLDSILNDGLIGAMDEVGNRFSAGDLYVPEMLMAARAMKAGLEALKPFLASGATQARGTVVIGTVKGDLHDIGKNLVSMMLEGGGFSVVDLGVNVDAKDFIQAARENAAQIVAMSALLTTTMPAMEATVKSIKEAGIPVKTIVGGAPITRTFAERIGADGYSEDAAGAVVMARELIAVLSA